MQNPFNPYQQAAHLAKIGIWEIHVQSNTAIWDFITKTIIHEVAEDFVPDLTSILQFFKEGTHRNQIETLLQRLQQTGEPFVQQAIIVTKNNTEKWVLFSGYALLDAGVCIQMHGSYQDIHATIHLQANQQYYIRQFNQTFQFSPIGMAMVAVDGVIIQANHSFCNLLGYNEAALLQLKNEAITHPEDVSTEAVYLAQMLAKEIEACQIEKRLLRNDGNIIWVRNSLSIICDSDENPLHFIVQIEDITYKKITEQAIFQKEAHFKSLVEASQDIIYELDTNGVVIYVTPIWTKMLDHLTDEVIGRNFSDFLHPEDVTRCADFLQKVLETGSSEAEIEYRIKHKNGYYVWHASTGSVVRMQGNLNFIGSARDITERKQTEIAISTANDRFSLAADSAGIGVWEYNLVNNSLVWDAAMYRMFDVHDNEFESIFSAWNSRVHPSDLERTTKEIQAAIRNEKDFDSTYRVVWNNGTIKHLKASAKVVRDLHNKPKRMIGLNYDITERIKLEDAVASSVKLQEIITNLSMEFINVPLEKLRNQTDKALAVIGEFAKIDRSYLFIYDFAKGTMTKTYEWCANGITEQIDKYIDVSFAKIEPWVTQHKNGQLVHVPQVKALVAGSEIKEFLVERGVKTTITLPLLLKDVCFGFIGFDAINAERIWSDVEIKLLSVLAELLSNAEERKRAEGLLITQRQRLAGIIEGTNVGTWEWDIQNNETLYNERWAEIVGYTLSELQPLSKQTWLNLVHPDDVEISNDLLKKCFNKEIDFYDCQFRMKHKNGQWVWIRDRGKVLKWSEDGNPLLMLGTHTDITQRKLNEQELLNTLNIASEQNKRLLNFAHIVSHNLRSHSGNFQTLIELLSVETDEAEKENIIDLLNLNAQNLEESIHNLNDVVQIQTNINQQLKTINLVNEIEKTLVNIKGMIDESKAQITVDIPANLIIEYNAAYIESILLNFLTNAIKYKYPDRVPEIVLKTSQQEQYMVLEISDNGLGIDLELQGHKLFGMYKTFHNNKDARGIGLFITKNQIEAMGGKVEVTSTVNVGTTFKIFIKA